MTAASVRAPRATTRRTPAQRYRHALLLLARRDLTKRYSTSALGYVWSILDPLLMAGIYYFVFVVIFHRGGIGEDPYIVFLLCGLLPWTWFNGSVSDATRAFQFEAKLIHSTKLPRTIWVASLVLSKGVEFLASIPVLIVFAIVAHAVPHWEAVYWIPAIALQAVLTLGVGLIVAPLTVFLSDLHRAVRLLLRVLFYLSAIVYSIGDLPHWLRSWAAINPLTGIFSLYRAAFFPEQVDGLTVLISGVVSVIVLGIGILVFRRSEAAVLKEI